MNERDKQVVRRILERISDALEFVADLEFDSFMADKKSKMATTFAIAQIAELSLMLSDSFKSQSELSGISWKAIKAFRNWCIHQYDEVNLLMFWDVVKVDLPKLKATLETIDKG
jgi:uncharacterized protein with HEPN domain